MKCPACGVEIGWGYPDQETMEMAERGEVVLAGCIVDEDNYCPSCGAWVFGANPPAEGR